MNEKSERKLKRERVEACLNCKKFEQCDSIGKFVECVEYSEVDAKSQVVVTSLTAYRRLKDLEKEEVAKH